MFETWITSGSARPFYARKVFWIDREVVQAQAKVCGLGQFVFSVNGNKISDHELDPAWTDYKKYIQYVTFDIKDVLHLGENVMGVEVGNGWYIKMDAHYTFAFPPFMPDNPNPYKPFGSSLVLTLELTIKYADGTVQTITADDSFKTRTHMVTMSNVFGSEILDGRMDQPGWNEVGFNDTAWQPAIIIDSTEKPKGVLENQFQPPVKVIHQYEAKYLHTRSKRQIYDLGQNLSGILDVEICGKPGDCIRFYPAEKLDARGDVDQNAKNWMPIDSCITCIVGKDRQWQHFRMKFTYFAGRYLAAEKVCHDGAEDTGRIQLRNLRGDAISSAHKTDGSFHCDDVRYNQIYSMIERTVEANMLGVHTDCPTIERFAWQEPNHLMASAIFYMKDGKQLWEKFLTDIRYAQHTDKDWFYDLAGNQFQPGAGLVPSQCPCYIPNVLPVPGMGSFYDIIPWGSTLILGAKWHYLFYGDEKIIRDNFDAGIRYLHYLNTKLTPDGFISHGLGDWGNPCGQLARENIETAFLYADTITLMEFAQILGRQEEEAWLARCAKTIRDNYNDKLLIKHPTEGFWCYRCWDHPEEFLLTQATQALPLFWGLVPEEKAGDVARALEYTLERDQAFQCGEVGLPYVIQMARKYGMNERISQLILRKEHPSYYAFILDGETTLGEYWETNPRSHCHDMMGHIIEWYYNGIAGILPEAPGFSKVTIRPFLPETIHSFRCEYQSASGLIRVCVDEMENEIRLEIMYDAKIEVHADPDGLKYKGKPVKTVCLALDRSAAVLKER